MGPGSRGLQLVGRELRDGEAVAGSHRVVVSESDRPVVGVDFRSGHEADVVEERERRDERGNGPGLPRH